MFAFFINASAYIRETSNEILVKAWIDIDPSLPAAFYFSADNQAWIRYRGAKLQVPLLATLFGDKLHATYNIDLCTRINAERGNAAVLPNA